MVKSEGKNITPSLAASSSSHAKTHCPFTMSVSNLRKQTKMDIEMFNQFVYAGGERFNAGKRKMAK